MCFPVKFLRTPFFTEEFQWLFLRFNSEFSKEFGAKTTATVSNKYQIQLKMPQKFKRCHRRRSVKEGLQGPEQVGFFVNICEIFKIKIST